MCLYRTKHLSSGLTIKRLFSYGASFVDFKKMNFRIEQNANAIINESEFYFGFALPLKYATNTYINDLKVYGRGWAFDLGMTYQLKERGYEINRYDKICEQEFEPYILKIGISLLDIGKIKFNNNVEIHKYKGSLDWNSINTLKFKSVRYISNELSWHYYGDTDASLVNDTTFSIGLPTTLSIQSDYHYYKNIYFGALLMLPIQLSEYQLYRPSLIAFMPRYETAHFEVSTSVSLYDFSELRLGLSVRYGFFTLGTDKLGAFMGFNNFDGFDFYFMIKLNFRKGKCANKYVEFCTE
jgi:hypothetical protein